MERDERYWRDRPGYDKTIAPNNTEEMAIVDVYFETIEVTNVYDKDGRFKLLLKQYMEWVDEDISIFNDYVELSHDAIKRIWTPQSDIITLTSFYNKRPLPPHRHALIDHGPIPNETPSAHRFLPDTK